MNDKDFQALWTAAFGYEDRQAYISDNAECGTADQLGKIWDVAHMTFKELIAKGGHNQSSFSRHFCVPLKTVQNWCSEGTQASRTCPAWAKLGFARQLNLI